MYGATNVPSGIRTRRAAERRWIRIPTPAPRRRAYGGETPNQVHAPNNGNPCKGGERERERELNVMMKKWHPTPPYIGQGGVFTSSPPPCGTKPLGRGVRRPRGWDPPWAHGPRGGTASFPLMGLFRPICLFPHF